MDFNIRAEPTRILMCHPKYFSVIDVKNEFMRDQIGKAHNEKAIEQWEILKSTIENLGVEVEVAEPLPDCEDMVFAANAALVLDAKNVIMSNMVFPSRQKETAIYMLWFLKKGYQVNFVDENIEFEGQGDALWHPGLDILYGGYGNRSYLEAYSAVQHFVPNAKIVPIQLSSPFYHLDTCFCPLNSTAAMLYEPAFDDDGIDKLTASFKALISVKQADAYNFACNAIVLGENIILNKGISTQLRSNLKDYKFNVIEVDLSEFLKSGGGAACMVLKVY